MSGELQPVSGVIDGARHLFPVRVYYEDTDLSGIVYHANYLKYAERARSDLLRLLGVDQRAAQEAGEGTYAVAEAQIHFRAPARLDDSLTVQTRVAELGAASVRLDQRVVRGKDVLADLTIRVGFVGPNGRPRRQPDAWRAAFASFMGNSTA
ncbi:tol-pal system-associated acyl-CoA thioesterase [Altererythrobacter lauratis]|uniref:Tol-pal system-associated acyl-CoA thioesterase n=1 Tax=Alteraurantiacibacter lauratis TaxID=2054627 RepID=A0ABV7EJ80_9SPHN